MNEIISKNLSREEKEAFVRTVQEDPQSARFYDFFLKDVLLDAQHFAACIAYMGVVKDSVRCEYGWNVTLETCTGKERRFKIEMPCSWTEITNEEGEEDE